MDKVLRQDPFDMTQRQRESPLHAALMPEDIFKGSHFERRFVTPFGKVWEKLAEAVGRSSFGFAAREHMVVGRVRQQSLDRIRETLDRLEHNTLDGNRVQPNWDAELKYVRAGGGPWQDVSVNCDVYVARAAGKPGLAFELKAAKPNSDQTKVSKEKLLKLHCMEPRRVKDAYYALPYSPYGSRSATIGGPRSGGSTCARIVAFSLAMSFGTSLAAKAPTNPSLKSPRAWENATSAESTRNTSAGRRRADRGSPRWPSTAVAAHSRWRVEAITGVCGAASSNPRAGVVAPRASRQGVLPRSANCVAGVAASLRHPAPYAVTLGAHLDA